MSADPTTLIAALGVEPTYSAQEAAAMLGRSCSWLSYVQGSGVRGLKAGGRVVAG